MNAVSLGKTRTLLIARGAGLLALAALAIAFFALPFVSYAMHGCGKKSQSSKPASPPSMATIFTTDIPHDVGLMQNLAQYTFIGVYNDGAVLPLPSLTHMTAMQFTIAHPLRLSTGNWVPVKDANGAFKQGVIMDTAGDLWFTDGTWGHLNLPANVTIVAAAQSQAGGGPVSGW
jgi:hypothetical protein